MNLQPFQVFSCWNGAAIINPKVFVERGVGKDGELARFRTAKNDVKEVTEKSSECYLICVDLWKRGMGRIMLVPKARYVPFIFKLIILFF